MSVLTPVIDYLDLSTKLIYLLPGVTEYHPVEDIYVEVRRIRRTDETMRVFDIPVIAEGAVPKGGGKYTPRYAIFNHGWKIRPNDVDHTLFITGEQITDDGQSGPACIDTTNLSSSIIIQYEPPAAEIIRDEDSLRAIAHMEFNGGITYDEVNGFAGTGLNYLGIQIGTSRAPTNNHTDATVIASEHGFSTGFIIGDATFGSGVNISEFTMVGSGRERQTTTVEAIADVNDITYVDMHVVGTLDGNSRLLGCKITDLIYVKGAIEECLWSSGEILVASGGTAFILDCWTGEVASMADVPVINMNGSGQGLVVRNHVGGFKIINKTGPETLTIILNGGKVQIDLATVTAGKIVFEGSGAIINAATFQPLSPGVYGNLTITTDMISLNTVSGAVWDEDIADHLIDHTMGHAMYHQEYQFKVIVDTTSSNTGTDMPVGTVHAPVNNIADALVIAREHGFPRIEIIGLLEIVGGEDISDMILCASSSFGNTLAITDAVMGNCYFDNLTVFGEMTGSVRYTNCVMGLITGFDGGAKNCLVTRDIEIIGTGANYLTDCDRFISDNSSLTIDIGSSVVNMIRCRGKFNLANKTGASVASIDLIAGHIIVDATCVAGAIGIGGIVEVTDNSSAGCAVQSFALNEESIVDAVWATQDAVNLKDDIKYLKDVEEGEWFIENNQMFFYSKNPRVEVAKFNLFDENDNPTMVNVVKRAPVIV